MPFASVNGVDLYYEIHGSGPALVMAHGGGSNHINWWQQVPAFAAEYTVVTFDHRGFGLSTDDGKGAAAYVDDLDALITHLGIDEVALLGQSMGGYSVTGYACRHPERVSALILSSSPAGLVPLGPLPPAVSEALANAGSSYPELAKAMLHWDAFPERHPELCFLFEQIGSINYRVNIAGLGLRDTRFDIATLVRHKIPMLLLNGTDDKEVCKAMRSIADQVPGARLEFAEDAGHLLFFERPDFYNRHVLDFVREHLSAKPAVD